MIPKRVLIPPDKPTSLPKQIQKPIQTDWDSPSSYTGTVKRRPPSIESPKTPVFYDVSSDKPTIIQISKDDKISPQEVTQGNDIFTQKRKGNKLSERKRHISNESDATISTSDQIESKPISSTLRRKSKLKYPSSSANLNSNLLPSTSTVNVILSKSNLPKLSQAKKACVERPKYTLAVSQSVEKEKQNFSTTLQVNQNVVATATTDVESKQVKNQFYNSELNKNKNKRVLRADSTVHDKTSYFTQPESHRFQTFTELYRDFPANYASTTVDRNISVKPPPYCYPPSPTAPSSATIYKQKNVLIETQKKIRFDDEDESLQHNNHHFVVDTSVFGVDCFTQQNANDSQHFRNKFALPKFENSPKRSGNRYFTSPVTDCETTYKNDDKKKILRANSNDYVLFNPTRKNFLKMNYDKSPSSDILAKPEFSSSVFKNIPVRPRKGIPHLENYCLFDPSTDFVNEKENKKNEVVGHDLLDVDDSDLIEEIIYEDQEVLGITSDDCDINNYCGRVDTTSDEAITSSGSDTALTENEITSVVESSLTNSDLIEVNGEIKKLAQASVSQSITYEKPLQYQSNRFGGGVRHKKLNSHNDKFYRHSSLPTSTSTKLIRHKCDESFLHQSNKFCENEGIENQIEVNLSPSTSSTSAAMLKEQKDTLKQSVSSPQLQNVSYKCSNKVLPLIESNYVLFYPAPVHSRNQYKIKPPRPISTHSDADSGFLSPATPDGSTEVKFNPALLVLQQCDSIQGYIEDRVGSFNTTSRNVTDREQQQQQSVIENVENISGSDEVQINNPNYGLHDGIEEIISDNESQMEPAAKRARTRVKEQYRPTSSSNHSQPSNLTKPLHILEPTVILEEQDTVISNRNECRSVVFENLLKEKEVLNAQLDRSMSLNDALQKGVDSCTKLYTMLETSSMKQIQDYILQLAKSESDTAKISEENATLRKELDNAKSIELLSQNKIVELLNSLAKVENDTAIISKQNATLHQQINEAKSIELSSQNRIVELMDTLTKVENNAAKIYEDNATLHRQLDDSKSKELSSQNRIVELLDSLAKFQNDASKINEENGTLRQQLDDSKSIKLLSQSRIEELLDSLMKVQNDAAKVNEENGTLRQQLGDLKSTELLSQGRIEELLDSLTKAESEMSVFKNQANAMLLELHGQIEELTKCEAEHENLRQQLDDSKSMESTSQSRIVELLDSLAKFENDASKINEENGTLRQQLGDLKSTELLSQGRIEELLDSLTKAESEMSVFKNQANAMLSELHGQIEELTKCEAEHENLRQQLDDSKSMESTSQSRIVELLDSLAKFENDASKINEENGTLRQQLDDSKSIELSSQSRIMELLVFKNQANAMLSELHSQIEELKKCEAKPNEQSNNQECDIEKSESEIYTDWANYYLERAKSKKKVADLSADCRDGLLLAEVIEAVTTFKVPDLVKKPKNQQQMFDNVNSCLNVLRSSNVGGLESITTNDICTGHLKAVLALFFALSRYKQASKQKSVVCSPAKQQLYQQQQHTQQTPVVVNASNENSMTNRQLPVPYSKVGANGGTAIPLPATVLVQRRCPPDKVRPLPPTPGHSPSIPGLTKTSGVNSEANSRPASPPSNGTPTHIPKGNNSFRPVQPGCKIPASPYSVQNNTAHLTNGNVVQNGAIPTKHSMLDKLKLFNKEKSDRSSKTQTSKRTSSSSGFSSARSERSDSSLSLNDGQNQQLPKMGNNKKPDVNSAKSKSKLLSTKSNSKDSVSSKSKSDRKDKSPARNEEAVADTKILPPRIQKIPSVKVDSKMKAIPPPKKLEIRSESKSSLSQIQIKPPAPAICTNIPKPMAFIKGTTKPTIKIDQPDNKSEKLNISNQNISASQESSKFQIVAPMSVAENPTIHHMHQQLLNGQNISMTDSSHSKSTHSSSTGLHSNSSESSVIYRPSSESGSDAMYIRSAMSPLPLTQNVIPNRKIDNFVDPVAANENQQKFHTVPTKVMHGNGVIFEEERQMTVLPMRPLLRGYNSHVTLPTRGMRGQHMVSEYCEDIGQGYCSDGDALRKVPARYSDIENGYMSEGGSCGIHAKHMNSIMRTRSQLPTTIEERCRSSRGENLDCMGTVTSPHTMEMNGCNRSQQRNSNRENWGKMPEQHNGHNNHQTPPSPTSSRKDKGSPSHSRRSTSSSKSGQSRTKGVPQSFGYVKRTNGSATGTITATDAQQAMMMNGGRTAHVSAVPRSNKVKVSGGTQTCSSDLQSKIPPSTTQHRSFSLTGPGAAQLSQSIRERLSTGSHSLPKQASDLHVFQHRISNRGSVKLTDGSLSDTQAYAEVKTDYSSYAMWLKHSNTASSRLSEGDSLESLGIGSPRGHKMIHRESPYSNSPRLNRSNSIRSTKSEKMYPSMLSRGPDVEIEPYYCLPVGTIPSNNPVAWSQPTSPTPPNRGFGGPLSPTHAGHRLTYPKKNDDAHGSAASLLSGGSSLYGSAEERQLHEVRRLKRELVDARDQVMSLSSQLSTNAHVVAAFEQSLTNMTQRLQQLSATADRKDSELTEMRQTIELLRKQSIQAGLTSAHMHSMNEQPIRQVESVATQPPPSTENAAPTIGTTAMQRHLSSDSMCSLNSVSSGCSAQDKKKKKGWLRSSFTKAFSRNAKISKTNRHHSTASNLDHLSSVNSSGLDPSALPPPSPSRSPLKMVTVLEKPADTLDLDGNPIVEDLKKQLREKDLVLTDIRLEALSSASQLESLKDTVSKMRQEMMNLKQNNERLQKLVTSRSLAGSEVSLGGPISPSGSMGEPRRYSLADGNLRPPLELPKSLEETEEENIPPAPAPEPPPLIQSPTTHSQLTPPPALDHISTTDHISTPADDIADHTDGKKIEISVYLAQPESFAKYAEDVHESDEYYANDVQDNEFDSKIKSHNGSNRNEFVIAYTYISGKTTWQNLDYIVRKTFKDYVARIDPGTNLGLNTDSITSYHLGEAKRGPEMGFPELLPCGYIVGNVKSLYICLQGVGSLAFDSLIPRSIVHRYISLLTEHRRLILCGPSGTGKSYLARKLAEFLVARSQRGNPSEAIATFNVDHKSSKELRQYLGHIAEQASMSNGASELPSVIILDNLHHASALGDVFQVLLSAGPAAKLPCIIGTMSQATCNTTNLQLHHNFRWVLTANHMEPVKGFLARFLRRRLYSLELSTHNVQPQLAAVLAWLPTVWQHINRFLETHSSSDVTIGPRLFLSCPLDLIDSQVWFTDIWNYHLEPYLVEAVREGVQLYGRRVGAWVDPSTYIRETYPWASNGSGSIPPLRLINAEDVGLEGGVTGNMDSQDPLLNMLMRLQEAANYSGNQEQESDCASLDSNITQDSSAGAE